MKINWAKLVGAIAICETAGAIGAIFTTSQIATWYRTLAKPAWNPPAVIFGPVWTTLFLLMGIALYLVWQTNLKKRTERQAFWLFLAHLVVNILWSVVFFGWHSLVGGLVVIIILLIYIAYLTYRFWQIKPAAGWLLLPYLAWVAFATYLNYTIWYLNR